jgi:hypothetical protein
MVIRIPFPDANAKDVEWRTKYMKTKECRIALQHSIFSRYTAGLLSIEHISYVF